MVSKLFLKLRKSFWLVPAAYCLFAIALAVFVLLLDTKILGNIQDDLPGFLFIANELAEEILGTITVSLLTMTTFTFSTMMIVLTLYSSQFSPRILHNFLTDRRSTTVLGVFMGSFIYALLSLFFMEQNVGENVISATIAIILVVICLGFFTFFIYYISTSIQVENLIGKLHREAFDTIRKYKSTFEEHRFIHISGSQFAQRGDPVKITAARNGYVQMIDYKGLIKKASKRGLIHVPLKQGEFVSEGEILALLYHHEGSLDEKEIDAVRTNFTIDKERTAAQDIEYSIHKLMDIALRAISPGINDPNTARECLYVIGLMLGEISGCTGERMVSRDGEGNWHLMMEGIDFNKLLYFTFYQVRHYGTNDISILLGMIEALIIAANSSPRENKKTIWEFHPYIIEEEEMMKLKELDRIQLQRQIAKLRSVCEEGIQAS
jgi:uncharacterized membrane protein